MIRWRHAHLRHPHGIWTNASANQVATTTASLEESLIGDRELFHKAKSTTFAHRVDHRYVTACSSMVEHCRSFSCVGVSFRSTISGLYKQTHRVFYTMGYRQQRNNIISRMTKVYEGVYCLNRLKLLTVGHVHHLRQHCALFMFTNVSFRFRYIQTVMKSALWRRGIYPIESDQCYPSILNICVMYESFLIHDYYNNHEYNRSLRETGPGAQTPDRRGDRDWRPPSISQSHTFLGPELVGTLKL